MSCPRNAHAHARAMFARCALIDSDACEDALELWRLSSESVRYVRGFSRDVQFPMARRTVDGGATQTHPLVRRVHPPHPAAPC